jgi:hypothetical protein
MDTGTYSIGTGITLPFSTILKVLEKEPALLIPGISGPPKLRENRFLLAAVIRLILPERPPFLSLR